MFGTLCAGGHAVLVRTYDPLHFAAALAACGAHLATTVPSVLGALVESRGTALPELRYFVSAAAPLHTATAQAVFERFGKRVVQGYGLSECMNFATTMPVDLSDDDYRALMLESTTPPVGRALSGCEVSIAPGPGNGTRTGPGVIGEVGNLLRKSL